MYTVLIRSYLSGAEVLLGVEMSSTGEVYWRQGKVVDVAGIVTGLSVLVCSSEWCRGPPRC